MQIKSILLTIFAAAALVSAMDVDPAVEQKECVDHAKTYRGTNPSTDVEDLCRQCRIDSSKQCASAKKTSSETLKGSTCYETALSKCKGEKGLAEPPQVETVAKKGGN
ncbi:uncharacterized protein H6S33_001275 [Morchella sextelata]|uniref:uncharacterized protein n=1 Tax=Morchella sextelata TaxID=1174677 RepID=UPI001D050ADC|nr:uncharacterized protein H6S33_001275 [Morchella sextelata]KAH0609047.1 hypothetical protein H6S33_001275 [Morchella sextelata]